MRLLISAAPIAGHLFPLLPMANAAIAHGYQTTVLTSADLAGLTGSIPTRVTGPPIQDIRQQTVQRLGRDWTLPGPEAAEMFAGVRVETTYDGALAHAREFGPDLILCDPLDFVGPMIASLLGVPWAAHGISGGLPPGFIQALHTRWDQELQRHRITATPRMAYIDPYPELLHNTATETDRVAVRHEPHQVSRSRTPAPVFDEPGTTALLTLGTTVPDKNVPTQMAESLAVSGVNVIVTSETSDATNGGRLRYVGFTPIAEVLPYADVVVSAGGTGTMLSALAAGLPLVIRPYVADQPLNASRAERCGPAVTITDVADAGPAARKVAGDQTFRQAARTIQQQIAGYPAPIDVLTWLARAT